MTVENKDAYNPGDVIVSKLMLSGPRANLDLTKIFMSCEIYESIFTPGTVGYFSVLDSEDYMGEIKPSGDETVTFTFKVPGQEDRTFVFALNSIEMVDQLGAMKAKVWKMVCVSKEALQARANHVSKQWKTQISNMASDVFKSYLKSNKNFDTEATKGIQDYIANSIKPFTVMSELQKRAVSLSNKSSNYLFFENIDGYKFVTMESLMKTGPIKSLKQSDTVGHSLKEDISNNILAYKLSNQMSAIDRIGMGALNNQTQTHDIRTKKYKVDNKNPNISDFTFGGTGSMISGLFKSLFGGTSGQQNFIHKDSKLPETNISEAAPDKAAYAAMMMQQQLNIEVCGDTKYSAGLCINADIPKSVSLTGDRANEKLVSGKFLMAKVAHIIKKPNDRPRYVCAIECLKGAYEEGV